MLKAGRLQKIPPWILLRQTGKSAHLVESDYWRFPGVIVNLLIIQEGGGRKVGVFGLSGCDRLQLSAPKPLESCFILVTDTMSSVSSHRS